MSSRSPAQRLWRNRHLLSLKATAALLVLTAFFATPSAFGDSQKKNAVSSGATGVTGGGFSLGATVGEAGAVGRSSVAGFALIEGFWQPNLGIATDVPPILLPPADPVVQYDNALVAMTPNPFRETTTITFSVAATAPVTLSIFDVTGRKVTTLIDEPRAAGRHQLAWNGRDESGHPVASGLYFARLEIGSWSNFERLLVIR